VLPKAKLNKVHLHPFLEEKEPLNPLKNNGLIS
jgi:hypothetical protein